MALVAFRLSMTDIYDTNFVATYASLDDYWDHPEDIEYYKTDVKNVIVSGTIGIGEISFASIFQNWTNLETIDLSRFNLTAKVTSYAYCFAGCTSLTSITFPDDGFNLTSATDLTSMFEGCRKLETDIDMGNWYGASVCPVTSMRSTFERVGKANSNITINLVNLNTSNVTTFEETFSTCYAKYIDLYGLDTSKATTMYKMFVYTDYVEELDLSTFDTSKVTTFGYFLTSNRGFFGNEDSLISLKLGTNFKADSVTGARSLYLAFGGRNSLEILDLSNFYPNDTTITADQMFKGCSNLTTIYCDKNWNIKSGSEMFTDCGQLVGAISYDSSKTNASYANLTTGYFTELLELIATISAYTDDTFTSISQLTNKFEGSNTLGQLRNWLAKTQRYTSLPNGAGVIKMILNGKGIGTLEGLCAPVGEQAFENLTEVDFSNIKLKLNNTSMKNIFKDCTSLYKVNLMCDLSSIKDCSYAFYNNNATEEKELKLNKTLKPTNISYMFYQYGDSADILDLSQKINLSEVIKAAHAFDGVPYKNFTFDNNSFSKCEDFSYIFANNNNITELNLEYLNSNKISSIESMFENCTNLLTLNIRNLSMHDGNYTVDPIVHTFNGCSKLSVIKCNHNWYDEIIANGIESVKTNLETFKGTTFTNKSAQSAVITKKGGNFLPSKTVILNNKCMDTLKANGIEVKSVYINGQKVF